MKLKIKTVIIVSLFLCLGLATSCTKAVDEPSPVGPSTYSVLLNVTSTANVIFAGTERETTTIHAELVRFNGLPLADRTIHFDVRDQNGIKTNVGFFDGNQSVKRVTTGQDGSVSVNYHGPLAYELAADATVYIYAIAAWEGKEFISENLPVFINRDVTKLQLDLFATPDVLYATSEYPECEVKAIARLANGIPLAGRKIFFSVLSGVGNFEDGTQNMVAETNAAGTAVVTFVGPKNTQLNWNVTTVVRAQIETSTIDDIDPKHEEVTIYIIKGT